MTKDTNSRFEAVPPLSELNDGDAAAACDAVPEYCDDAPLCADVEDCAPAQESCVPDDFFDDAPASEPEHEESLAVKSADSDGFVVEKADLTVPTLLEASAGTGKTFSIKHLVLRLIVEQEIPINSLLVVTFTKAATAELKSRIREHLAETHGYLTGIYATEDVDPLVVRQVEIWRGMAISDVDAVKRLRESLARFDDSAINTIHGFCQKMLSEHVFTSAGNFDTELSDDDAALRDEVTEAFLRRELDACTSADERRLLMQGDDWAGKLRTLAGLPEDLAYRGNDAGTVPAEKGDGQFFHVWSLRGYVLKTVNYASMKFKYDYFIIFLAERHPWAAEVPRPRTLTTGPEWHTSSHSTVEPERGPGHARSRSLQWKTGKRVLRSKRSS